jgi:hypothetical protein
MLALEPCPHCQRHVAITEAACPFCAGALPTMAPRTFGLRGMSRAAVFAGATLATACGGAKHPVEAQHVARPPAMTADAGVASADAATAPDEIVPTSPIYDHQIPKPYGAPPARRRVV